MSRALVTFSLVLALAACGKSTPGQTKSVEVGPAGGALTVDGAALTVPANALATSTQITVTSGGSVPSGYTGLSPLLTFEPDGTQFAVPATITFTLGSSGVDPVIYWSNAAGGYDELPTTVSGGAASATILHFSHGFVGERRHDADAGTGSDAGLAVDAATDASVLDGAAGDASVLDAGATDAGATADAGALDAGAADAGVLDAGTIDAGALDAGTIDAGASADAGALGLTVLLDGVSTVFATNMTVTVSSGLTTIAADDSAATPHQHLAITVNTVPQQLCGGGTAISFIDATGGSYVASTGSGSCTLVVSASPTNPGDHSTGSVIAGTLNKLNAPVSSPATHTLGSGNWDFVY